jgi:transcriptional regulator with XRE-family HTH domain
MECQILERTITNGGNHPCMVNLATAYFGQGRWRSDGIGVLANSANTSTGARGRSRQKMPNGVDNHVGQRVRLRRASIGVTQDALAQMLGLSFQQLQKYESGENRISVSRLHQLSIALDAPVDWFFEGLVGQVLSGDAAIAHLPPRFEARVSEREVQALLRAYAGIASPRLRRMILETARAMAEETSCPAPVQRPALKTVG